jgi:HEAT repeat protein
MPPYFRTRSFFKNFFWLPKRFGATRYKGLTHKILLLMTLLPCLLQGANAVADPAAPPPSGELRVKQEDEKKSVSGGGSASLRRLLESTDLVWPAPRPSSEESTGPETAHGILLKMTGASDAATRKAAAEGLRAGATEQGMDALFVALADPSPRVRTEAMAALKKVEADKLFLGMMNVILQASGAELARLDPAIAALKDTLEKPMLGVLMSPDAPDNRKAAAAYALGRMRSKDAIQVLAEQAWVGQQRVSQVSANALAYLRAPETVELLAQLLQHSDEEVRWSAVVGLGQLGGPVAVEALSKLATNPREPKSRLRKEAAVLLGLIGDLSVVPALIQSMKVDYNVRHHAGASLRRLTGMDLRDDPTEWEMWYMELQRMQAAAQQPPPLVPSGR